MAAFLTVFGPGVFTTRTTVGWILGWTVGWILGWTVGWTLGWTVGWTLGWIFGWILGSYLGKDGKGAMSRTGPAKPTSEKKHQMKESRVRWLAHGLATNKNRLWIKISQGSNGCGMVMD